MLIFNSNGSSLDVRSLRIKLAEMQKCPKGTAKVFRNSERFIFEEMNVESAAKCAKQEINLLRNNAKVSRRTPKLILSIQGMAKCGAVAGFELVDPGQLRVRLDQLLLLGQSWYATSDFS